MLHGAALAVLLVHSLVFPGKPRPLAITPTLRVDVVGLPDLLKNQLPTSAPPPSSDQLSEKLKSAAQDAKDIKSSVNPKLPPAPKAPVSERADPDELVLKPKTVQDRDRSKKNRSALDRIRSLVKVSNDTHSAAPSKNQGTRPGMLIKGNAISRGTSLTGEAREAAVATYYDALRDRLQENWALPVWLTRQNFSARVHLLIDARGSIKSFRFVKPSGSEKFDEAVKKTLNDSQPFPIPPEGIASSLLSDGILVGFPL